MTVAYGPYVGYSTYAIIKDENMDLWKIEKIAFSMRFVDDEFKIQELVEKHLNFHFLIKKWT